MGLNPYSQPDRKISIFDDFLNLQISDCTYTYFSIVFGMDIFLVANPKDHPHLISLNISHCKDAHCQRLGPQYPQEPIASCTQKIDILEMGKHSLFCIINNYQIPLNHKSLNHKHCRLCYCLCCRFCCLC